MKALHRIWQTAVLCIGWVLAVAAPPAQADDAFVARVSHVTDGDTLWVVPASGGAPRKLRLLGIDAPEICQPGGAASRAALQALVEHRMVEVSIRMNDSYQRGLAQVRVDGQDVAEAMVLAGQAWAARWRGQPGAYAVQEAAARAQRRGLFAEAVVQLPRDFRRQHGSCHAPDQR